jgi:fumarylacetoacetase
VAIGDQIIDLAALAAGDPLQGVARAHCQVAAQDTLNAFMFLGPDAWRSLRHALFALLLDTASAEQQAELRACLVPQSAARFGLPTRIGDYTDFYTSIHHARNVGRIARPDDPLTANFQWMPIAYHGRASSVVVSGTPFRRPMGQAMAPGAQAPVYGPLCPAGLRAGAGRVHRPRQCDGRADPAGAGRAAPSFRHVPAQ